MTESTEPVSEKPEKPAEKPAGEASVEAKPEALAAAEKRIDELARAYSGLLNDQKDFRARLERENERRFEGERAKIAEPLLKIGDEIERALAAAGADDSALAKGVRLIHESMGKTLLALGLERIPVVGQPFDPNLAEAVDLVPVAEADRDGVMVQEVSVGYRLGGKVLRPARVRVARFVAPVAPAATPEQAEQPKPA